jgi:hypothetical protein
LSDPAYWNASGGNSELVLCACSQPTVGGLSWGGSVTSIGSCVCRCTTINIIDQDIINYGPVHMYYQCCDGQFFQQIYGAATAETRCISRVLYLVVFDRGVWYTIPNIGGTSHFTYGGTCCGGSYGCGCEELC